MHMCISKVPVIAVNFGSSLQLVSLTYLDVFVYVSVSMCV